MKKINMPTTPEGAIKSRARNLPVGDCYINSDWKESKLATIFVTRKHINGNITFACYEVDLNCLGLKDSFYQFNYPKYSFIEMLEQHNIELVPADYKLVHNIIFSAISFAEEYGFKPHKSFNVSKYILEDDDDFIDYEDIECGMDGKPVIFSSSSEPNLAIIKKLEETAGNGNYIVYYVDDEENDSDDDDFDHLFGDDDISSWGTDDYIDFFKGKKEVSLITTKTIVDNFYRIRYPAETVEYSENTPQCKEIDSLELDDCQEGGNADNLSEKESKLLSQCMKEIMDDNIDVKKYESIVEKYPENKYFCYILYMAYYIENNTDKALETIEKAITKFPDDLLIVSGYVYSMLSNGNIKDVEKHLKGRYFIKDYNILEKYSYQLVVDFYSVIAWYHLLRDDVLKADQYMYAIEHIAEYTHNPTLWVTVTLAIIEYKIQKIDKNVKKGIKGVKKNTSKKLNPSTMN